LARGLAALTAMSFIGYEKLPFASHFFLYYKN